MTVKEKIQLLTNGVKWAQVQELEEQEKLEIEAEAANSEEEESKEQPEEKPTIEDVLLMIKELQTEKEDLQSQIATKNDEVAKLNEDLVKINNHQTVAEQPVKETGADVFKELFHPDKKEV